MLKVRRLRLTPCPWLRRPPLELAVTGRFARWMRKPRGPEGRFWRAFTLPIPFAGAVVFYWMLSGEERPAKETRFHEHWHCRQREERGAVRLSVRWLLEVAADGYKNSSTEREAYEAQRKAQSAGWEPWV